MPGLLRARRRLGPRLAARPARSTTATTSCSAARRPGPPTPSSREWCAVLARTDPDAAGHRGISYSDRRPRVAGHRRPAAGADHRRHRVRRGLLRRRHRAPREPARPAEQGWAIAMHTLAHERGPTPPARQVVMRTSLDRAIEEAGGASAAAARRSRPRRARLDADPRPRRARGAQAPRLPQPRPRRRARRPGPESSVDKLFLGHDRAAGRRRRARRARPLRHRRGEADDYDAAFWHHFYLYGRAASVYGGTAQIQKNIIAQRILGLPRSCQMDLELEPDQRELQAIARGVLDRPLAADAGPLLRRGRRRPRRSSGRNARELGW